MWMLPWCNKIGAGVLCLIFGTGAAWAQAPQTWVVSVGVDEYVTPSVPDLKFAGADAKLISQSLQDLAKVPAANIFTFTSDAVQPDLSPRATNIMYRLSWLRERCKAGDTLVFFFAGHGMQVDQQGYLLTEETDNRSADTLKVSSLRSEDLFRQLFDMPTSKILFIFDACRNEAGSTKGMGEGVARTFSLSRGNLEYATIFSCKVGERSWEWQDKRHGFFTYHLAEGLKGGAVEPGGEVSLHSLTRYLGETVPVSAQTYAKAQQNPTYRYEGPGTDRWVLARLSAPAAGARPSGAEQSRLIAQLDAARAQLEQAQAEKKLLQDQLMLQQTESKKLMARLEIVERQAGTLPGGEGLVAARDLANQDLQKVQQNKPSSGSNVELLEAEKEELRAQNLALQARIKVLELKLGKENMSASRDATLASDPVLQKLKNEQLASAEPQKRLSAEVERLRREQHLFLQGVPELVAALSTKVPSPPPDMRVSFLNAQIEIYVQSGKTLQKQLENTQRSLLSLQNQKDQSEARLRLAEAALQKSQAELERQKKELDRLEASNQQLKELLVKERQENEVLLAQLKVLEDKTQREFKGVAIDSQWNRITRRARVTDIIFDPNVGEEEATRLK
jgi:uncharacterized caspase-like protein